MEAIARVFFVVLLALGLLGSGCGDETTRTRWPAPDEAGGDAEARHPAVQPPAGDRPYPDDRLPDSSLAPGRFLVAARQLDGPFFARTVVLLLDYSATGALGLIVNRPTDVGLDELLPALTELSDRDDPVFMGGPVEPELMVFLIRSDGRPPGSQPVIGDIHATGSADALRALIEQDAPQSRFHTYVGYAGWAPGQLDAEVARGDWYVTRAEADQVFDPAMDDLWERLVREHEGLQVRVRAGPGQRDELAGAT